MFWNDKVWTPVPGPGSSQIWSGHFSRFGSSVAAPENSVAVAEPEI